MNPIRVTAPSRRLRASVLVGLVFLAAFSRLVPHPPNFTPIGAIALFGGACFASRRAALLVPFAAMLASDIALELLSRDGLHGGMPAVYACLLATAGLGMALRRRRRPFAIAIMSGVAALGFFVVTNFAVWLTGGFYPHTWSGFATCYLAALPFFGNTLAGQLVFGVALFGGLACAERAMPVIAERRAAPPLPFDRQGAAS